MEFKQIKEAVYELPKEGNMRVPVRFIAEKALLDKMMSDRTMRQAKNVASLPGIVDAAYVMPDGHEGYGFPIGGVAAFDLQEGIVSPGGVGYDINCGVRLIRTNLTEKDAKPKINELIAALFKNVPTGVGSKSKIRLSPDQLQEAVSLGVNWAVEQGHGVKKDTENMEENGCMAGGDYRKVSDLAKKRGGPQLGTLGSGNHFIEVQRVERIFDEELAKAFGVFQGQITIMIHSGSRGYGHQVCDDFLKSMLNSPETKSLNLADRELCSAPINSQPAQDYLAAMKTAINFAFCNRHLMMNWTREAFEQVYKQDWESMGMELLYDVCHNIAKIEEHKGRKVCVHRKGATRAFWKGMKEIPEKYRNVGQPVIIPGSMNTASYLLCGMPGAAETFGSSCHGAGRVMSRHQAMNTWNGRELINKMRSEGMAVQVQDARAIAEEAGGAYKDVDAVVKSVEVAGISKIVARMVPIGVIKG